MLAKLLTTAAVAMLATAPAMAAPTGPAAKLSLTRTATVSNGKSKIHGAAIIVALLSITAVVGGTIVATDNKGKKPTSP